MELNQVLVAYKQVSTSPHGGRKVRESSIREGNALHLATLDELYEILKEFGISFESQNVRRLQKIGDVDLVITVGGDGTVLAASHFVENQPILGIKSFGRQSVGYFCAATRQTMRKYIKDLLAGRYKPIKLHRLQTSINGRKVAEEALNDILFASALPASTSRYKLFVGSKSEEHKSSGVWVSTAAGSTAAMRAAGGKVISLTSEKIEYLVREPYYVLHSYKLLNGIVFPKAKIKIVSSMPHGTVYIDGGVTQYPAPTGAVVCISGAANPLRVYWR
jgi:NAD+ kinase